MDKEQTKLALQTLERLDGNLQTLKSILTGAKLRADYQSTQSPTTPPATSKPPGQKSKAQKGPKFFATSLPADQLGPTPDFQNDDWPIAVDPSYIVPDGGVLEKQYRALQIIGLILVPMENKTILDCGCGEGYNAREIANTAAKVVGYDIKPDDEWAGRSKENLILTSDKTEVLNNAPYDLIVLYDVLDHLQGEDPEPFMKWVSSMLSSDGQIFIRTHPWASKTGGHYYEDANKAWLHLALTADELAQAGLVSKESNLRVIRPMAAYEQWFKNVGLTVETKQVKTAQVDDFFTGEILERIIKVSWGGGIDADTATKIMSNSWIDYFLRK